MLYAVAPEPKQNYCPFVVVNNTTLPASQVYFVATALDPDGIPCFLTPNTTTGVCSYVYPNSDGSNSSAANSVTLSQLPLATNTGIKGTAYLFYLPISSSGRAYFSIQKPMYLSTTYSASRGMLAINSPSIISLNDPNYYVPYQDFEFGLDDSQTDSSTQLFVNLSWVDYFCLPMKLYGNSYLGAGSDPTINNSVCYPSGMPTGSTQVGIMTSTINSLSTYPTTWGYLPVPYYASPYTSSTSSGTIRILSPKNSAGLASGRLLTGGPTMTYFPLTYATNTAAGPSASTSYYQAVYNYYLASNDNTYAPLYTILTPSSGLIMYEVVSDPSNAGRLLFNAYQPNTTTAIPADNTYIDLYSLAIDDLLSGGITFANGFTNATPIGAELGKLLSALFSIGQLPYTASVTSPTSPFYNAEDYQTDGGYVDLTYFSNPPGFSGGPWYNYYDQILHKQMVGAGTLASNPTLGVAYAYDYDDLLGMSGIINGLEIQDQYGNPVATASVTSPYVVMELQSMSGALIPSLTDTYYYTVTVGAAANGATVEFIYNGGSTTAPISGSATPFTVYGGTPISGGSSDYLHVEFDFNGETYTYNINLLGQIVTPLSGGNFSAADVQYQGGFSFSVTGGTGTSGNPIQMTINFNSSPTPWQG